MTPSGRGRRGADLPRGPRADATPSARDDPSTLHERAKPWRGIVLIALAVVVGVLVMPSAARAPLDTGATSPAAAGGAAPAMNSAPPTSVATTAPPTSAATTAPAPAPSSIHVLVANATTVSGAAGAVTSFLGSKGFGTLPAVDATAKTSTSQIYFTGAGSSAAATEVASALGLPPSAVQAQGAGAPVSNASSATAIVVVGQDLASRFAQGTPASTTTTTTAPARR